MDGVVLGYMGQIHPLAASNYGMDCEVYCAEMNFTTLMEMLLPDATYTPLPKYPAVTRDLSVVCDEALTVGKAEETISAAAGKLLRNVKLFDIYRGANLGEGKKSLAFSLELRADDHTLTDADTEPVITKVLAALEKECGATLR
jgi:phenylalanyl-tRNA synthetase beta chain